MQARPAPYDREDALVWGAPMAVFPVLAWAPVAIWLFLLPLFPHARLVGVLLLPVLAFSEVSGLVRLSSCFDHDFDVLTLLAGGTVFVLMVVAMCAGVLLGLVVTRP